MRKFISILIIAVLTLCLTSCGSGAESGTQRVPAEEKQTGFKLYRTGLSENELVWEYGKELSGNTETQIRNVLAELESTSDNPELKKLKPDNVKIIGHSIGADGQLIIDFSSEYLDLSVVTELLLRAGYVKTLCQIDGIEYIEFNVNGEPLILGREYVIGQMKGSDFIDNTGESVNFEQEVFLTVYFLDESDGLLEASGFKVNYEGVKSYEEIVTGMLLNGPPESEEKLLPTIPEGTVVNSISSKDDIVYVDFNDKFLNYREGVSEEMTIYSVVNSLCDLQGITKVRLTINGEQRKAFNKYMKDGFFERKPELISGEKAGEVNG